MRVLHIIDSIEVAAGGTATALPETVRWLATTGVENAVLFSRYDKNTEGQPAGMPDGTVLHISNDGKAQMLLAGPGQNMARQVAAADLIHLHGIWDPILIAAAKAARAARRPVICTPHGMLAPWCMARHRFRKWPYYHLFTRPMLTRVAALQIVTKAELENAAPWLPNAVPTFVVPYILAPIFYGPLTDIQAAGSFFPQIPQDGPWVLFLSRLHPKKGLPRLIAAFPEVLRAIPKARLIIAGNGEPAYEQKLRAMVEAAGIAGRSHFLGLVKGPAKMALYRRAAILAVPSSQENFGLVFAESLACETPVLLTPGVDLHHEIMQAKAGFLTDATSEAVAANLTAALLDEPLRLSAGRAGRRWVLQDLAPQAIARSYRKMYESALSSQPGMAKSANS